ncbi:hypothetical protein HMPREF9225_1586 [Peptoniphilus duerdenii ATCC BAA-1640]|uniref:Uncharacterized protein n=1 Tax=Peptoniphilus duerdenii ATCC BAA-1640 TaxID=862517 RepID=E0NN47_9FIRM|nr:hypothetical protein HMPREF9225_1586 [Peptoniphilus duerdenii ATCC BAA-1640]
MQEHFNFKLWVIIQQGITPACAGTFDNDWFIRSIARGSPLRVQEHLVNSSFDLLDLGITPACAGTFVPK